MHSVIQSEKECYICKTTQNLHDHHVFFGTSNRKQSEKHGMKVWLCAYHHNMSGDSVHHCRQMDLMIKKDAQRVFEQEHRREEFIAIFGKSYL